MAIFRLKLSSYYGLCRSLSSYWIHPNLCTISQLSMNGGSNAVCIWNSKRIMLSITKGVNFVIPPSCDMRTFEWPSYAWRQHQNWAPTSLRQPAHKLTRETFLLLYPNSLLWSLSSECHQFRQPTSNLTLPTLFSVKALLDPLAVPTQIEKEWGKQEKKTRRHRSWRYPITTAPNLRMAWLSGMSGSRQGGF